MKKFLQFISLLIVTLTFNSYYGVSDYYKNALIEPIQDEKIKSVQIEKTPKLKDQINRDNKQKLIKPGSTKKEAENGSYQGQISEKTGRPKNTYVQGYYRKNGTYVRGHYRS